MHGVRLAGRRRGSRTSTRRCRPEQRARSDMARAAATRARVGGRARRSCSAATSTLRDPAVAGLRHVGGNHVDHVFVRGMQPQARARAARPRRTLRPRAGASSRSSDAHRPRARRPRVPRRRALGRLLPRGPRAARAAVAAGHVRGRAGRDDPLPPLPRGGQRVDRAARRVGRSGLRRSTRRGCTTSRSRSRRPTTSASPTRAPCARARRSCTRRRPSRATTRTTSRRSSSTPTASA